MVKKRILCFLVCAMAVFCFCGCVANTDANNGDTYDYISLTIDNYDYLLTIDDVVTGSGSAAGGSVRWSSHKVTIYGALNGIYDNCILSYKYRNSDNIIDVQLNIAGYATFNYTTSNTLSGIVYVNAQGRIYF